MVLRGSIPRSAICSASLQERRGARAVVVDAGTIGHGVEVCAGHDHPVVAARRRLGDQVLGRARPSSISVLGLEMDRSTSPAASSAARSLPISNEVPMTGMVVGEGVAERASEGLRAPLLALVEDDHADGAGHRSVRGLDRRSRRSRAGSARYCPATKSAKSSGLAAAVRRARRRRPAAAPDRRPGAAR